MNNLDKDVGPSSPVGSADLTKLSLRIRLPDDKDWPSIRGLVRKHHERTVFSRSPFSVTKYDALERQARAPQSHQCLLVAERKEQLLGLAWFSTGDYVLSENCLMTTTHLIAVDTDRCGKYLSAKVFTRLLRGISIWSKSRGSKQVLVHVTTGTALRQTDRLMRAGGARSLGGSYLLEV